MDLDHHEKLTRLLHQAAGVTMSAQEATEETAKLLNRLWELVEEAEEIAEMTLPLKSERDQARLQALESSPPSPLQEKGENAVSSPLGTESPTTDSPSAVDPGYTPALTRQFSRFLPPDMEVGLVGHVYPSSIPPTDAVSSLREWMRAQAVEQITLTLVKPDLPISAAAGSAGDSTGSSSSESTEHRHFTTALREPALGSLARCDACGELFAPSPSKAGRD